MKSFVKYIIVLPIVMLIFSVVGQNKSKLENPEWTLDADWTISAPLYVMKTSAELVHNSAVSEDIVVGDGDTLTIAVGVTFTLSGSIDITSRGVVIVNGVLEGTDSKAELDVDGTFIVNTNGVVNWAGSWDNVNPGGNVVIDGWIVLGDYLDNNSVITGIGCIEVGGDLDNSGSIFGCSLSEGHCGPYLGNCPYPLPVELTEFNIEVESSEVKISWATASELGNDYFTIQRSTDGRSWEGIITIDGAGTSTNLNSYEAYDNNYIVGLSYYRLMQTDFDGGNTYSETKAITMEKMVCSMIVVYPNPSKSQFTIEGDCLPDYQISLYNGSQQRIQEKLHRNGTSAILDVQGLTKGVYFLQITDGVDAEVIQLIVE